jgi:hypothetical protein
LERDGVKAKVAREKCRAVVFEDMGMQLGHNGDEELKTVNKKEPA